jgi:hypothetical protein
MRVRTFFEEINACIVKKGVMSRVSLLLVLLLLHST